MPKKTKQLRETQMIMFEPSSDWRPPDLNSLPDWTGAKRVGIDCEGCDPMIRQLGPGIRRGGRTVGYSFAIEDGPKFYLPYGHEDAVDNLPRDNVMAYLKHQLKRFDGELVGANIAYDLDYMWEDGLETPLVSRYRDVQIADPLIWERHMKYSLQAIAERHGFEGKNETLLKEAAAAYGLDPKADMWRLKARFVGDYAEDDADLPLKILRKQERILEENNCLGIYDLESRLTPVLVKMRRRGVAVDMNRLEKVHDWTIVEEQKALDAVKSATGCTIGLNQANNATNLRAALTAAGLDPSASTAAEFESMKHPVAAAIVRARKMWKIRTTFVASIATYQTNGRIHCTFHQMRKTDEDTGEEKGVAVGRLSCADPNMQQQPGDKDPEVGPLWRAIFRPDEGKLWTSNDFSQQEPKWSFHFSALMEQRGVKGMAGALALCDQFKANPNLDVYQPLADACGIKRKPAKIVWLARCYGKGGGGMARDLGMPTRWMTYDRRDWCKVPVESDRGQELVRDGAFSWEDAGIECQAIIDSFDETMPFLKSAAKKAIERVKKDGFITTALGRRCHFEKDQRGEYNDDYRAFNRVIQGSAADQVKQAVVDMDDAGIPLQLQVHDEINWSAVDREEAEFGAKLMRESIPGLLVPFKVDVETGDSWGDSMKKGAWVL